MNINKSSWHFKLLDYWDFKVIRKLRRNESVTLCQYFWNVVGAVFFTSFMVTLLVLFASVFVWLTVGAIIGLVIFFGASWLPVVEYGGVIDTMYSVGLTVYLLVAIIQVSELAKTQVKEGKIFPNWMKFSKQKVTPKKETKPNILFEYVKAKKNKFCPIVKLED